MAGEEDKGVKFHFRATAGTSAPALVCPPASRLHAVFFNEGPSPVRMGTPSGTVSTIGMLLPSGTYFYDYFSDDDWWIQAVGASSGTVSGFLVEGL
jgi:hypothetical protein